MRPITFVVTVASVLAVLPGAAVHAQQNSMSNSRLMFDPNSVGETRRPANQPQTATTPAAPATSGQSLQQPAVQQAATPQPQAAPKPAPRAAAAASANPAPAKPAAAKPAPARRPVTAERTINDTTAANRNQSTARPVPREEVNLGRVALPQGSLGYENRTQLQTYDLSDGRGRVPGYDNIQRNDSSYFGLSLRMPTLNGQTPSSSSSSPSWGSSSPSSFGSHGAN